MLRANIHQSASLQFNGLEELSDNWLYFDKRKSDIFTMPISPEVQNAHTT
jgi:hypothetical protein